MKNFRRIAIGDAEPDQLATQIVDTRAIPAFAFSTEGLGQWLARSAGPPFRFSFGRGRSALDLRDVVGDWLAPEQIPSREGGGPVELLELHRVRDTDVMVAKA